MLQDGKSETPDQGCPTYGPRAESGPQISLTTVVAAGWRIDHKHTQRAVRRRNPYPTQGHHSPRFTMWPLGKKGWAPLLQTISKSTRNINLEENKL
ncbi:hypothetical protein J6590_042376 [Homalodisca vitripennis]|nr:hypothetical protein J6590_042376 [Homalodisca vitripennis]